jgi:tetratricopeptide (TPR) repeat protein
MLTLRPNKAVGITLLTCSLTAGAHRPDPREESAIVDEIAAACPAQRDLARRASADFHDPSRRRVALAEYEQLARCARSVAIVYTRIGFLKFESGDFAAAEATYRKAVALEPSFTNRLSLLETLAREKKPEADALYAELARYEGDRDDIWAGLAYVAFHRDDVPLMRKASARAIALDTKWWQPWFTAAIVEGLADHPDYPRALRWLDRADALGAPPNYTKSMRSSLNEAAHKSER